MVTEEIKRIEIGKWDHEDLWARVAEEGALEAHHDRILLRLPPVMMYDGVRRTGKDYWIQRWMGTSMFY